MDFKAIDHVIANLNQLGNKKGYEGRQQLQVRNEECFNISHTSSSCLLTPLANKCLYLKNILYVPHITKNLFNISKLTKDNNVMVEFNSYFCFSKDWDTRVVLP